MKKALLLFLSFFMVLSFGLNVEAKGNKDEFQTTESHDTEIIFEEEITVDEKGGKFNVGFAELKFKNGWLDEEDLPITFTITVYAEDGEVYIEITPDVDVFLKDVVIRTMGYTGYIYDVSTGENIYVEIPKQKFEVEHFSRWCWGI